MIGLGFLLPLVLTGSILLFLGRDVIDNLNVYLQTITQGAFSEGWRLPFDYFWHAEHGFFPIIGLIAFAALIHLHKHDDRISRIGWLGIVFVYLCLVIPSNLTHSFVVYGRLARQLMPFLVLAAGGGLSLVAALKPAGKWLVYGIFLFLILQSIWNYRSSYLLVYPREFVQEVQVNYPDFDISPKMMRFYAPLVCQYHGFLAANVHYLYDWTQTDPPAAGEFLLQVSHPVNFLPYQYEGYTPQQRQELRERNFQMVFSRLDEVTAANINGFIENCYQER